MTRRPLIDQYKRTYGLPRTVQDMQRTVQEILRSDREGDVIQRIFSGGGGGSGGGAEALQDAYDLGSAVVIVGGTPIILSIAALGEVLRLNDNAQLLFGTGADAGFWYDGGDLVIQSNVGGSGDLEFWGGRQLQGFAGTPGSQTWVIDNATARVGLGIGASSTPWIMLNLTNPAADRDKQQIIGIRSAVNSLYTGTPGSGITYAFKANATHSGLVAAAAIAALDWDILHASPEDIDNMWGFHGYPQSNALGTGAIAEAGAVVLQGVESSQGSAWLGGVEPDAMYGLLVETLDFQTNHSIFRGVDIRKQTGMASAFSFRGGDPIIADDQAPVRFEEATANGDNYVGLKAPASIAASLDWELPAADGAANARLKTDGAGVLSWQPDTTPLTFVIDGGGSAITTGIKGHLVVDFPCTVTGWTILGDQSGSAVVDVEHCTYANFPTTASIAGSEKPTLSSAQKNQDLALSTWTVALAAGDILEFEVESATTCERLTVALKVTKT